MKNTLRRAALAIALSPLVARGQQASMPAAPPDRRTLVARIDSLAADYLASGPVASASVAVVKGADTIVLRGYGLANRDANRAAGPSTIYEIGSLTKQYTAALIMKLVEQGKVQLDADVATYLPAVQLHGHHVTVRQLLNHTSGIPNYTAKRGWRARWADDLSPDSVVAMVASDTFDFAPGTKWSYSNTNYMLLGMIIEKVTGKPYATYLDQQIVKPLHLTQTSYCPSKPSDTSFAAGYSVKDGALVSSQYLSMTHPYAAGALCASVRDYVKWQRAINGGRVLKPASYQAMTSPTVPAGSAIRYGFGVGVDSLGGHAMLLHGGGINGFTTFQMYFPAETLSVVAFTNTDGRSPQAIAMNIARAFFEMPLVSRPVLPPTVPIDSALRASVLGTYDFRTPSGGTFTVNVFLEEGRLMSKAEGPGQGAFPLLYFGDQVFGAAFDPTLRFTVKMENGKAIGARLDQRGMSMEGVRRPE